jgi:hypothetical protein
VMDVLPKVYPPPALRLGIVSGLHCTIPNGASAPGKVFPPPVVHVRVSTSGAGSVTACVTTARFFAPAGSLEAGTGPGQLTGCPFGPLVHAAGETEPVLALAGTVGTLELGLGAGLGPASAAAGAAVKDAATPRTAAAIGPTITRRRVDGDG